MDSAFISRMFFRCSGSGIGYKVAIIMQPSHGWISQKRYLVGANVMCNLRVVVCIVGHIIRRDHQLDHICCTVHDLDQ